MSTRWSALLTRRQPPAGWRTIAVAGLGGLVSIAALTLLAQWTDSVLLAAAFGSSAVLVFTFPEAPLSQPVNVVGGHLISTASGLFVATVLPVTWWSLGLAVALAIMVMAALRMTHPPAGGNPIVVMMTGSGWAYLLAPILVGSVLIIVVGALVHRLAGHPYPVGVTSPRRRRVARAGRNA